jgi:hypothetical protein
MCPVCIATATWLVATTLFPAAFATVIVQLPGPKLDSFKEPSTTMSIFRATNEPERNGNSHA